MPRKLYILDIESNKVIKQPGFQGNNIIHPVVVDIDQDGIPEITGSTFSPDNFGSKDVTISDSLSWLLLYNADFTIKSKPLAFSASPSYINVLPLSFEDEQLLIVHYRHKDHEGIQPPQLMSYKWKNDSLVRENRIELASNSPSYIIDEDPQNPGHFFLHDKGTAYMYSGNLKLKRKINTGIDPGHTIWDIKDLDLDENMEFLAFSYPGTLTVFRTGLKRPLSIELPEL